MTQEAYTFLNDWWGGRKETLKREFGISDRDLSGVEILLASYVRDAFYGEAFVLFRKKGKLFEVNGYHDSGGGMEGQWEPEETFIKCLRHRLEIGRLGRGRNGFNLFADELRFLLAQLEMELSPVQ